MTTILIADACKPSIVMTSEVFKDRIQGSIVLVARSGQEALALLQKHQPELCVVDFALPDVDGVSLVAIMREMYRGPILLTAHPDKTVTDAVNSDLFGFDDASGWLSKPIKVEDLNRKIDCFLLQRHRIVSRYSTTLGMQVIGKGAGRGKRAPKVTGKVVNMSFGGACLTLDRPLSIKSKEEFTVSVQIPVGGAKAKPAELELPPEPVAKGKKAATAKGKKAVKKAAPPAKPVKCQEAKFKATLAWHKDGGKVVGIKFSKMTHAQKKGLELYLRDVSKEG